MSFEKSKTEYINFKLGNSLYALPIDGIEDITPLVKLSKIPLETAEIAGIFLKDEQVTVALDLAKLYGQNTFAGSEKVMIIAQWQRGQYGLVVDSILEIGALNPESRLINLADVFRKVEFNFEYDKSY